jgi:hypothetical protein
VLLRFLQGSQFFTSDAARKDTGARSPLSQADVVALISFVLTIIRALAGSSTTLIGWRMAFVALKKPVLHSSRSIKWFHIGYHPYRATWLFG